jgi:hypothetical protein
MKLTGDVLRKAAKNRIRNHAKRMNKGKFNYEKLGEDIERLKGNFANGLSMDNYSEYCEVKDLIEIIVDEVYDEYFKIGGYYVHQTGNNNFRLLCKSL